MFVSLHPRPRGPQEAGAGTEKRLLGAAREGGVPSKRRGLHALSDEVLCNKGRDGSSTKVGILFFFFFSWNRSLIPPLQPPFCSADLFCMDNGAKMSPTFMPKLTRA